MPDPELLPRIKSILANEWKQPAEEVPDDAALNKYPAWDSLGHIRVMLALQNELGIELTADSVQSLSSIPRIIEYIETRPAAGATT